MKKVILFDLGNTLINNTSISLEAGLNELHNQLNIMYPKNNFINEGLTLFKELYKTRNIDNIEVKFTVYLSKLLNKFNIITRYSLDQLEEIFYDKAVVDDKIDDVIELLDFLKRKKYKIYIISNSTFSKKVLQKTINKFNIYPYIDNLFSSSDIGYRKPDIRFLNNINELNYIDKKDMVFIGNDKNYDLEFAKNLKIDFIWYNKDNERINNDNIKNIKNYKELLCKWGEIID